MRIITLAAVLALAGCGPSSQSAENLPAAPTAPAAPSATPTPPIPGDRAANLCVAMTAEEAAAAQKSLPDSGRVSSYAVRGGNTLVCNEPATDGDVGCELAAGGSFVVSRDGAVSGYRNETRSPVAVVIGPAGGRCTGLRIPPSPEAPRPN